MILPWNFISIYGRYFNLEEPDQECTPDYLFHGYYIPEINRCYFYYEKTFFRGG
jgi:hypothetical protein